MIYSNERCYLIEAPAIPEEGGREGGNRRAEKGKNTSMLIYCTANFCIVHKAFSQLMI